MTKADKEVKRIFFSVIVKTVIKKIVAVVPFLGLPVIGGLFSMLVMKLAEKFYEEAALMGAFMKIDFNVESQRVEYEKATEKLKEVLDLPISSEERQKARSEYEEKLRDLITFNPNPS